MIRRLRHQRLHPRHDLIGGDGAALHVPGIDPVVIGQPRALDGNDDIGSGRRKNDPDRDWRRPRGRYGVMGQAQGQADAGMVGGWTGPIPSSPRPGIATHRSGPP